ncbi:MAG: 2-dehydropantoate 2-reductase [Chloroflexi bacterium]|nr:MAG: 2-dehydropantoate 2-reductase [Chloroflexota bacterium]TME07198.1 MAG: 2-dehydropantoate 2-reductase [Chloroflexota bacterium]TME41339.1 MAG: 2-dehydropantoate 2-reductase [Chloroflexota bacterium]TME53597.1 MAG: 2-dehydropantoate 2-reductase [Chloroflexota bacterium]
MTVAIVGAGAIGGLLGGHLARSGEDVILVARGAHLAAMQANGLTVRKGRDEFTAHPRCTDDMRAVAEADVVFITLKAHSIPGVATLVGEALKDGACVVGAMNGIPWWYFPDRHLESVDPGGVVARSIPLDRVVGCVVYPAATIVEPGVIQHEEGDRFSLGEPDGAKTERVQTISTMLSAAGFKAPVQSRLRSEIWLKLLGNATLNPISAVTRATLAEMFESEASRGLIRGLMEEVASVARSVEVEVPVSIEKRMQGAAGVGEHKTSMLQDLEAHKALELDALLGAVIEIADWRGVAVPLLRTLYGLTKLAEAVALRAD